MAIMQNLMPPLWPFVRAFRPSGEDIIQALEVQFPPEVIEIRIAAVVLR